VNDPSTYWLTFTNVALGLIVLICCVAVAVGVLQELALRRKKEASALDREVADLAAGYTGGHAFRIPNLGITMADGGEHVKNADLKKEKR
jgi:hypothetical protein